MYRYIHVYDLHVLQTIAKLRGIYKSIWIQSPKTLRFVNVLTGSLQVMHFLWHLSVWHAAGHRVTFITCVILFNICQHTVSV